MKPEKNTLYNLLSAIGGLVTIPLSLQAKSPSFILIVSRILSDLALTAEEKYLRFIKLYPDIEKHIKNYHLASYLGITTESLIRERINKEITYTLQQQQKDCKGWQNAILFLLRPSFLTIHHF